MSLFELQQIAWQLCPTTDKDCWSKCLEKDYERRQIIKRIRTYLNLVYS
jgi:hypothetical protein